MPSSIFLLLDYSKQFSKILQISFTFLLENLIAVLSKKHFNTFNTISFVSRDTNSVAVAAAIEKSVVTIAAKIEIASRYNASPAKELSRRSKRPRASSKLILLLRLFSLIKPQSETGVRFVSSVNRSIQYLS